jgi:hypothetical protein
MNGRFLLQESPIFGAPLPLMRKVIAKHELPSKDEMLAWMSALCADGHRMTGTDGGRRAEERIEGWFREIGLQDVVREKVPLLVWEPEGSTLTCSGSQIPSYPIARAVYTPAEGISGPLVHVGEGDPDSLAGRNLSGKIAVAEIPFAPRPYGILRKTAHAVHDPDGTFGREPDTLATWILPTFARAYSWCAARGAAAFLGILRDLRANRCRYHYPYANPQEVLPIPGAFLGRDDGRHLLEAMRTGSVEGHLATRGRTYPGAGRNVLGFLPGVSDAIVLVASHHDTPFGGFVQDSSGMAQVLAIARHFARKKPEDRALSMVFLAAAGNFAGNAGARAFLDRHAHDLVPRIALTLTIEHIGAEVVEKDGVLVPTGDVEPRGIYVTDRPELLDMTTLAIRGNDLRRSFVAPVPADGSAKVDGEAGVYFAAGLPSITCISGPEYVLTDEDGPGLSAPEELVPVAKTFIEVIEAFLGLAGG